jgi:ubiquinone/menaquinone biosynthesis C-methylase UbiE
MTKRQLLPLAAGPVVAGWIVSERRNPRPMSPFWSFTLEGKARIRRLPRTLERMGVPASASVLEIGCGPGVVLESAAGLRGPGAALHAIDVQPEMVARAHARLRAAGIRDVPVTAADAATIPYPDGSFDLVYMMTVIGELPDPDRVMAEIRRVLEPGGVFAVTEQVLDPHYTTPASVRRLCERGGLRFESTDGGRFEQVSRFRAPAA